MRIVQRLTSSEKPVCAACAQTITKSTTYKAIRTPYCRHCLARFPMLAYLCQPQTSTVHT